MNFYYDITLDFLENNYPFYEVCENDCFSNIKKIPLFQITSKVLKELVLNKVKVSSDFLKIIENKTPTEKGIIKYACILADKNNALAFIFDDEGVSVNYSALSLNDELNLLEVIYTIKNIDLEYEVIEKKKANNDLRKEVNMRSIINQEIDKLYQEKNKSKLQFLYLEWFNNYEEDVTKIYQKMKKQIQEQLGNKEENIFHIIEISYNNV